MENFRLRAGVNRRMSRSSLPCYIVAAVLGTVSATLVGCNTAKPPTSAATLEPTIRKKVEKGLIEPGFTPEMVYLALGKPTVPADGLADATRDGTWEYHRYNPDKRDFVRAGFRQRVVFDPSRRSDVIVTEPIDDKVLPHLRDSTLVITFRDGRVSEITRINRP